MVITCLVILWSGGSDVLWSRVVIPFSVVWSSSDCVPVSGGSPVGWSCGLVLFFQCLVVLLSGGSVFWQWLAMFGHLCVCSVIEELCSRVLLLGSSVVR